VWRKANNPSHLCNPPFSHTVWIRLKMDYTQWTWERLNFEWEKQNYVLSLIRGKTDVSPKMYFYITVGCCSLAWSSDHIKGNREGDWNPFYFMFVAILQFRAATLDSVVILEVIKLTPIAPLGDVDILSGAESEAKTSVSSFLHPSPATFGSPPLHPSPRLLISGAGNRSHESGGCNRVI